MHGLILAAGRGSRLGSLTALRPKCLVELEGKPLLHWQIEALNKAGISPLTVIGGYRSEQLEGGPYTLVKNPDWERTNMVASLLCAPPHPTLVAYADLIYQPAIPRLLSQSPGEIALTYDLDWLNLWSRRFANPLEDAETFRLNPDGTVASLGQKPQTLSEIQGQYMGLLKITSTGWSWIHTVLQNHNPERLAMTDLLSLLLTKGYPIHGVPIRGGWGEVDSASDLPLALHHFHRKPTVERLPL